MQLPQPLQGSHPGETGLSCLEYALQDKAVVPDTHGIFLAATFRMNPALAGFISDAIYQGRLGVDASCRNHVLHPARQADAAIRPCGLSFVAMNHAECTQRSDEEIERILALVHDLLRGHVTAKSADDYRKRRMKADDIMVVAPYNMQVNALRAALDRAGYRGVTVGTVDKFQGREAQVVIVSMTTSDAASMPRDASFLLSRHRLNVAVSRAKALAIVVASIGLLDLNASSVEEMRLANLLCHMAAVGQTHT